MPQRGSLVAECVRVMRLRIEAGEWTGSLPGERRLAELLQVGRDTVRLTLAELESQGLLEPAEAGKRRQVAAAQKEPVKTAGAALQEAEGQVSEAREAAEQERLARQDAERRAADQALMESLLASWRVAERQAAEERARTEALLAAKAPH